MTSSSVIFGCHVRLGIPSCTEASIDQQLDQVKQMGVVQMELVNIRRTREQGYESLYSFAIAA